MNVCELLNCYYSNHSSNFKAVDPTENTIDTSDGPGVQVAAGHKRWLNANYFPLVGSLTLWEGCV